jgi:formylmethanofuran dehydrogenase subunit D
MDNAVVNIARALFEALGWHKGMALVVVRNEDGSVTIKKA